MPGMLENKVAIVTGAGSGIGRAIAIAFGKEGARVVVSDLDEPGSDQTVADIGRAGGQAFFVRADVSRIEDNAALVKAAADRYGALHIAVNNAGIAGAAALVGDYPVDSWDKVIGVNLSGCFYGMRHQIPAMLKAGGGVIVNMASILGQVAMRGSSAYVSAKHGLVGLTRTAALEYAKQNIRVNAIGPGFIMTPLLEKNLSPEQLEGIAALHAMGRLGEPREVADLTVWLCSDQASFVTGAYYAVDGGYLAQ